MNSKNAIFIDGGYLARILKNQFGETRISFNKLGEEISQIVKCPRLRTYYYTCEPIIRKGNVKDSERQALFCKFVSKLRKLPRFEVKLGRLQLINNTFKQKIVDVLMSLDISTMSYENQVDQITLIAGDSDFLPAINKAKDNGTIVNLFYHPSSVHQDLLNNVDERHEINDKIIKDIIE